MSRGSTASTSSLSRLKTCHLPSYNCLLPVAYFTNDLNGANRLNTFHLVEGNMPKPRVRKGMPNVALSRDEFSKRMRERFYDPSFAAVSTEIEKVIEVAWRNYSEHRKSPITRRAGPEFHDPEYALSVEWLDACRAIVQAEKRQKIPGRNPESSSSTALRATTKLVREKYPRHFALQKWLRGQSSTRKASRSTCST